jgi:hypothetical protein
VKFARIRLSAEENGLPPGSSPKSPHHRRPRLLRHPAHRNSERALLLRDRRRPIRRRDRRKIPGHFRHRLRPHHAADARMPLLRQGGRQHRAGITLIPAGRHGESRADRLFKQSLFKQSGRFHFRRRGQAGSPGCKIRAPAGNWRARDLGANATRLISPRLVSTSPGGMPGKPSVSASWRTTFPPVLPASRTGSSRQSCPTPPTRPRLSPGTRATPPRRLWQKPPAMPSTRRTGSR